MKNQKPINLLECNRPVTVQLTHYLPVRYLRAFAWHGNQQAGRVVLVMDCKRFSLVGLPYHGASSAVRLQIDSCIDYESDPFYKPVTYPELSAHATLTREHVMRLSATHRQKKPEWLQFQLNVHYRPAMRAAINHLVDAELHVMVLDSAGVKADAAYSELLYPRVVVNESEVEGVSLNAPTRHSTSDDGCIDIEALAAMHHAADELLAPKEQPVSGYIHASPMMDVVTSWNLVTCIKYLWPFPPWPKYQMNARLSLLF